MGWPYGGNWDGLEINDDTLATLAAAICTAINEREEVLGFTETTWLGGAVAAQPSASDFDGIEMTGSGGFDELRAEIMVALFSTTNLTASAIAANVRCGNASLAWLENSTDTAGSFTRWTIDAVISDAGTLTKADGRYPRWEHATQLEWWKTVREVLDRLLYVLQTVDETPTDFATESGVTGGVDAEDALRNAWANVSNNNQGGPEQQTVYWETQLLTFSPAQAQALANLRTDFAYDTGAVVGTVTEAQALIAITTPLDTGGSMATPTYTYNGSGVSATPSSWVDTPLGNQTVSLTMSSAGGGYPHTNGDGDAVEVFGIAATLQVIRATTDLSVELTDQA